MIDIYYDYQEKYIDFWPVKVLCHHELRISTDNIQTVYEFTATAVS